MQLLGKTVINRTWSAPDRFLFEVMDGSGERVVSYQFGFDQDRTIVSNIKQVEAFGEEAMAVVQAWLEDDGPAKALQHEAQQAIAERASQGGTLEGMLDQIGDPTLKSEVVALLESFLKAKLGISPVSNAQIPPGAMLKKAPGGTVVVPKDEDRNQEYIPDEDELQQQILDEERQVDEQEGALVGADTGSTMASDVANQPRPRRTAGAAPARQRRAAPRV